MNSNIRELSGSCDTISSTGAESTASRESHRFVLELPFRLRIKFYITFDKIV